MENCCKQMFITLALVLLKLKYDGSLNILQSAWLRSLDFMCKIYVKHYNETIYGTVSFDITHRIPS